MKEVIVGSITGAHGIRGQVKVYPYTDNPERLLEISSVYVGEEDRKRKLICGSIQKNLVLLKIDGIENRNDAEKLKGQFLTIDREDRKTLEDGQYFIEDLKDCIVYLENNEEIGRVKDVLDSGGNYNLVISTEKGETLIPFIKVFIPEIDIEEKKIIISPIEGMLE